MGGWPEGLGSSLQGSLGALAGARDKAGHCVSRAASRPDHPDDHTQSTRIHINTLTFTRVNTHSHTFSRIFVYILRITHAFTHIHTHVPVLMFMHAPSPSGLSPAVGEVTRVAGADPHRL